jgi:hypothetical protein
MGEWRYGFTIPDGRGSIPGLGATEFSLFYSVQTGSGAHPASCPMITGCSFPGGKEVEYKVGHSPPFIAEIKNGGVIPPLTHTSSWRGA